MAEKYGIQYANLHGVTIDVEALRLIPEAIARAAEIAIFSRKNKSLSIGVRNPQNPHTVEQIASLKNSGYDTTSFLVSLQSLNHAWERYADAHSSAPEKKGVLDVNPDAIEALSKEITSHLDVQTKVLEIQASNNAEKVSHVIETAFGGALALGASDIHIEPEKHGIRLRYRLDGVLWDVTDLDQGIYKLLNSRLKLLSGLILNVRNEAQDGRFTFEIGDHALEVRTSVIPGAYGESIVMRLLDPNAFSFKLANLGLNDALHAAMVEELARPNGAIITTGPTGSGKTTALYAFMQEVHTAEKKIITIEDPVEYKLEGIVQTQVDDEYTFPVGLRAVLRQDPDIIMVGEIRDEETASLAINAALTGHLVLATVHTNSASGTVARLVDMGVEPFLLVSTLRVAIGQRLVRRLCDEKEEYSLSANEKSDLEKHVNLDMVMSTLKEESLVKDGANWGDVTFSHPKESADCEDGYKGRMGIHEVLTMSPSIKELVLQNATADQIEAQARKEGMLKMVEDGVYKAAKGLTSVEEVLRVVNE